jgi:hypothetical protein
MRLRKRVGLTILFLAMSAATVVVLSPGETTDSQALAVGSTAPEPAGTAAMRAYIDPETGELTTGIEPTESVLSLNPDLQNALSQDSEGLVPEYHADGSVSLDLQGRFQSASIARIGKDGKVIICTDNVAGAEQGLTETTSNPGTPEVK